VYAATSQMEKKNYVIADHVTQFQPRSVHTTCIAKSAALASAS